MDLEKELAGFSKHIPKVLRQQLMCELVNDYIQKRDGNHLQAEVKIQPTIQRFYGALLFVDISGFTVLSQKLDVESLKNNINNYFKKMLEVVDKWGGDVIKFAGDAVYIIWPINTRYVPSKLSESSGRKTTDMQRSFGAYDDIESSPQYFQEMKKALEKAVACGLEICISCGKHEVFIGESNERQSNQLGILGRLLPSFTSFLTTTKVSPTTSNHTISYLDVHAGVSMGLMAAIDIGYDERWEFFILGDPIAGVAAAEASAEKGDVAMCAKSHAMLHPNGDLQRSETHMMPDSEGGGHDTVCACGCIRNAAGSYIVKSSGGEAPKGVKALRRSRSKSKLEEAILLKELSLQDARLVEDICADIEKSFISSQPMLKRHFIEGHMKYKSKPINADAGAAVKGGKGAHHNHHIQITSEVEKEFLSVLRDPIHDHFVSWMKSALVVETVFHVHDASRHDYTPPHRSLTGEYFTVLGDIFHSVSDHPSIAKTAQNYKPSQRFELRSEISDLDRPAVYKSRTKGLSPEIDNIGPRFGSSLTRSSIPFVTVPGANGANAHEATSASELRSVTIMFIKIDGMDMQLTIDPNRTKNNVKSQNVCYESFGFLDRTDNEIASDELLLGKLQSCISVLGNAIYSCGGQMRQFMVDDKGTVCIATFGLRGAVMEDNAASAIETGLKIIQGLQRIDIISSIGITTGKAYCGQVGSPLRHEFAVMGPSVNLSARLMCKAGPNSIMCDHETASRDRFHEFNKLSAVVAKGYAHPVMTYSPKVPSENMKQQLMTRVDSGGFAGSTRVMSLASISGCSLRVRVDFKTADRDQSKFNIRLSTKNSSELPPGEKLWRLLETDFFIPSSSESFLGEGVAEHSYVKLYGRKQEMAKIFSGLFTKRRSGAIFCIDDPCRIVALCGAGGIGKSCIATAFAAKLFHASKKDLQFNVFIMKNRPSSLHSNIVFNTWRPIIAELCRSVSRNVSQHNIIASKRGRAHGDVNESILSGFQEIANQMPKSLARYGAILTRTFGFNNDRIEEEDRMEPRMVMLKCCEIMASIISISSKMMKKMILIVIEDTQSLDAWSLAALHQIWLLSTGVTCLVNYTTALAELQGGASWTVDVYEQLNGSPTESGYPIFQRFDDPRRFKLMDIMPLEREALDELAEEMMGSNIGHLEVNRIFDASGGNPLYAIELVKTLMSTQGITSAASVANGESSPSVDTKTKMEMNHRVEEIICFRLDKLSSPLQTVLKAAAVASSSGKAFDAVVISFILQEHDYFAEESKGTPKFRDLHAFDFDSFSGNNITQVEEALEELVSNGDFIRFVMETEEDEGDVNDSNSVDSPGYSAKVPTKHRRVSITGEVSGMGDGMLMEFKIPVEQATIYGLIVDEQKEYFHERVALFCIRHMSLTYGKSQDTAMIAEEAYHWEHSSLWSRALSSYLKLGEIQRRHGDERAWLQCIYRAAKMYKFMEEETCSIFPFEEAVLQDESLAISIIKQNGEVSERFSEETIENLEKELDTVYDVFAVDMLVLPKVARLYVDLVNIQLSTFDDIEQVTFAMGVALKLFVACNYWMEYQKHRAQDNDRFSSTKFNRMMALNSLQLPVISMAGNIRSSVEERATNERNMAIKTTDAENHELLCAVTMVRLMYSKVSSTNQFLTKTLLDTAGSHLHFYLMDPYQVTAMNNVKILELVTIHQNYVDAEELLRARQNHRDKNDTRFLIYNYNLDYGNFLQAHLMQYALLGGYAVRDSPTMRWYIHELHSIVRIYKHGPSIAWLLLSLLPTLVHIHEYEEAQYFMDVYEDVISSSKTMETLPPMLLTILRTWVICMQDLAFRNQVENVSDPCGHELLLVHNIMEVVTQIDEHPHGIRLCEESLDGITLQMDNFMFNCGCGLEFIALSLSAYLIALSDGDDANTIAQNGFIKRLDALSKLIQFQDHYGSALNVMNMMNAFRFALACNEEFSGTIVRSSVADGFTYRLFSFIEAHLKLKMYYTVIFLADFALHYLHTDQDTLTPAIADKYNSLAAEAERMICELPERTEFRIDKEEEEGEG
jgi:class 3 adenylate cyclase